MDFVRRWMAQIQVQFAGLSLTTKMLIGTLALMMLGVLLLVVVYAGAPAMEPLFTQPLPSAQQGDVLTFIKSRGYDHKLTNNQIYVSAAEKYAIVAALNAQQVIRPDEGGGFADLLGRQNWWQSNEQMRQSYNIALQNELAGVIRLNRGVTDAKVIISNMQKSGFGQPNRKPTAQVTVAMSGGTLSQKLVDAIAGQVSGAVAGLTPQDVNIIDAGDGRVWQVRDKHDLQISEYVELIQTQEQLYRMKIEKTLDYIEKVIVAVNVELDPQQRHIEATKYSKDDSVSLIEREERRSESSRDVTNGGAPGAEANVSATIPGGSGTGRTQETEESKSEFASHPGVVHERTFDPGVVPTRISASISVPRSYFVKLYKLGRADDTPDPTDAVLQPIIDTALPGITRKVENLIAAKQPGRVVVDTYLDDGATLAGTALAAAAGPAGSGGVIGVLFSSGSMIKHISLGTLAAVSLLMMFMMMRKATQPPKLPSAAELAGIPPALQSDEEVIGEATELDAALTGVELDEGAIRNRKLTEQVGEMVRNDPGEAASLLGRWVHQAD